MEIEVKYVDQTPFLLSGSVRDNLDPTRRYGDGQLWRALSRCHLAAAVTGWGGLDADVLERGSLLSAGQKQLLCLARALLLNAQVRVETVGRPRRWCSVCVTR